MSDTTLKTGGARRADESGAAIAAPDAGGLASLYDRYWAELCNYINKAFGGGPPDPEDVAQTAFEKYAALNNPDDIRNPRAFLYTAARNTVFDHKRREKTKNAHADDLINGGACGHVDEISPERVLIDKERLSIIEAAVAKMPEKQRHVFLLSALEGCGYAEISRRTGVPPSSVRRYVTKALKACDDAIDAAAVAPAGDEDR